MLLKFSKRNNRHKKKVGTRLSNRETLEKGEEISQGWVEITFSVEERPWVGPKITRTRPLMRSPQDLFIIAWNLFIDKLPKISDTLNIYILYIQYDRRCQIKRKKYLMQVLHWSKLLINMQSLLTWSYISNLCSCFCLLTRIQGNLWSCQSKWP